MSNNFYVLNSTNDYTASVNAYGADGEKLTQNPVVIDPNDSHKFKFTTAGGDGYTFKIQMSSTNGTLVGPPETTQKLYSNQQNQVTITYTAAPPPANPFAYGYTSNG